MITERALVVCDGNVSVSAQSGGEPSFVDLRMKGIGLSVNHRVR
jgi:hypothetical protein